MKIQRKLFNIFLLSICWRKRTLIFLMRRRRSIVILAIANRAWATVLRDEPLEITGAKRGGWKFFSSWIFIQSLLIWRNCFSGVYDLFFFLVLPAVGFFLHKFLLQEYFLGNCHPTSVPNPAEVMFSLQCTMLEAMTDISIFVRRHLPRTDGKAFSRRLPLFGRISRAGTSTSLSVCMINTWYICCVSGQVEEMDVKWSEVVSYRRCRPTYRSTQSRCSLLRL